MIVKLLTKNHLEFLSLKGGCRGSSESTFVKLLEISCRGSFDGHHARHCFYHFRAMKELFEVCAERKETRKYEMTVSTFNAFKLRTL